MENSGIDRSKLLEVSTISVLNWGLFHFILDLYFYFFLNLFSRLGDAPTTIWQLRTSFWESHFVVIVIVSPRPWFHNTQKKLTCFVSHTAGNRSSCRYLIINTNNSNSRSTIRVLLVPPVELLLSCFNNICQRRGITIITTSTNSMMHQPRHHH